MNMTIYFKSTREIQLVTKTSDRPFFFYSTLKTLNPSRDNYFFTEKSRNPFTSIGVNVKWTKHCWFYERFMCMIFI